MNTVPRYCHECAQRISKEYRWKDKFCTAVCGENNQNRTEPEREYSGIPYERDTTDRSSFKYFMQHGPEDMAQALAIVSKELKQKSDRKAGFYE